MYDKFVRDRINELRMKKNVSEYQLSLDLGHSQGYIQSITSTTPVTFSEIQMPSLIAGADSQKQGASIRSHIDILLHICPNFPVSHKVPIECLFSLPTSILHPLSNIPCDKASAHNPHTLPCLHFLHSKSFAKCKRKLLLMTLFDDEQILKAYAKDLEDNKEKETERKTAARMIKKGKMSLEEIADCVPTLSLDELKKLQAEVLQLT